MCGNASRRDFLTLSAIATSSLSACAGKQTDSDADKIGDTEGAQAVQQKYPFRFADTTEGKRLIVENEEYLAHLSQVDLDFRLQRKGGTLEEWKAFAVEQVLDFTDEEKEFVSSALAKVEQCVSDRRLALPDSEEIVFVKTTMHEECDAGAYTHGTQIFLGERVIGLFSDASEKAQTRALFILAHELFHCLTRSNPDFRSEMYSILGFEVQPDDFDFGPTVSGVLISNPDVEHHNSSREFTISGEARRCAVIFYATRPFEKEGDSFFELGDTGLVPVDDLDVVIPSADVDDYWEIFGENTDYTIDPEEVLADNFAYTVIFGRDGMQYKTPLIIDEILTRFAD